MKKIQHLSINLKKNTLSLKKFNTNPLNKIKKTSIRCQEKKYNTYTLNLKKNKNSELENELMFKNMEVKRYVMNELLTYSYTRQRKITQAMVRQFCKDRKITRRLDHVQHWHSKWQYHSSR